MNEYAEMLECQLRFAEEEKERAVEMAYQQGVEEGKKQSSEHAHWDETVFERNNMKLAFFMCSNCFDANVLYARHMKYCPNCGAKMDEEGAERR